MSENDAVVRALKETMRRLLDAWIAGGRGDASSGWGFGNVWSFKLHGHVEVDIRKVDLCGRNRKLEWTWNGLKET